MRRCRTNQDRSQSYAPWVVSAACKHRSIRNIFQGDHWDREKGGGWAASYGYDMVVKDLAATPPKKHESMLVILRLSVFIDWKNLNRSLSSSCLFRKCPSTDIRNVCQRLMITKGCTSVINTFNSRPLSTPSSHKKKKGRSDRLVVASVFQNKNFVAPVYPVVAAFGMK